jgi:hypothetical protein
MNTSNFRKILLLSALLLSSYTIFAQNILINGFVMDSTSTGKHPLNSATISLASAKDSSLLSFTRSEDDGYFELKNVAPGKYLVSISYVGYQHLWLSVTVGASPKLMLGNIYLMDATTMSTVTVTSRRPPVVINKDTIEFNSENFKTVPNAVVEDLLKKMPGIEVDKAGAITVNGKAVTKIYVNGKEFFTGDPKMATKNLPADAIDKIQVYDRKSDQAMFTGIDDGSEETSINLKIKKDRNHSTFGKVGAGFGTPSTHDASGNISRLNDDEQMSLVGAYNNTNKQGFSNGDISSFSGAGGGGRGGGGMSLSFGGGDNSSPQGVAKTLSGGANYSNVFNNKATDFNGNIAASDVSRSNYSKSLTQNLTTGNLFNRKDSSKSNSDNQQQRFGTTIDHKISETLSFKFTPNITKQHNTSDGSSDSWTYLPDGTKTNETHTISSSVSDALNASSNLLIRKKFAKKGRTISSTINNSYNESSSNSLQNTDQLTYTNNVVSKDSIIDRKTNRTGNTKAYSVNVVYTEPLGKRSILEFNTYLNKSIGESSKKVYDNKTGLLNTTLTNEYNSEYTYSGGGMNFRTNQKKVNFSTGFSLQDAHLNGENVSAKTSLNHDFKDILPSAMFQYNFSQTQNLNINYRTSTNQPSITQLQPVLDQSNINNQSIGNPDLKRSYMHNVNIRFFSSKILAQRNFFATFNASTTNNSIVNYDSILPSRAILSKPVNVNGAYRVNGALNYGFGLKKLYSRFNIGLNGGVNNNISYSSGKLNTIITKSLGPSISYNFQLDEIVDLDLSARYSYSKTNNAMNAALNTNYLTRVYSADVTNYLPFNLILNQSMNYTINSGRAAGYNTSIPIWNASISKYFTQNKRAELKFSAFDLLNKNAGISRSVSQNQIVDQAYNVINQYFILSFTYSLQKSGLGGGGRGRQVTIRM